jgi:hypothetical protein
MKMGLQELPIFDSWWVCVVDNKDPSTTITHPRLFRILVMRHQQPHHASSMTYKDEDGDEVLISDDESLTAAVNLARTTGLTLKIMTRKPKNATKKKKMNSKTTGGVLAAASVGAAVICAALLIFSRQKKLMYQFNAPWPWLILPLQA